MLIGIYRPCSSARYGAGIQTLMRFGVDFSTAEQALRNFCSVLDIEAVVPKFSKQDYEDLRLALNLDGVKCKLLNVDMEYVETLIANRGKVTYTRAIA